MSATTIVLVVLAAIAAAGLAFYFYFIGKRRSTPYPWLFGLLRFITLFAVFLLLINPTFTQRKLYVEKPELLLAADNSTSISNFGSEDQVRELLSALNGSDALLERFNISTYTFGADLKKQGTMDFSESQTNIFNVLDALQNLYSDKAAATVLITDGNQTLGSDYGYFKSKNNQALLPVLVGDTTSHQDISISQLNANRYGFLNNRFPVEAIIKYDVQKKVQKRFEIRNGNSVVFSKVIDLDPETGSEVINTTLPATSIGKKLYTASVAPLDNEKNVLNNNKKFAVDIIDERSKILMLTDISHPDIGALKRAIEANQQRGLDVKNVVGKDFLMSDYQLIILYQPNQSFNSVFQQLKEGDLNYFVISGLQTDWNFLNNIQTDFQKENSSASENFLPLLNENFAPFQLQENPFDRYPPLEGAFGEVEFKIPNQVFLFQKIDGIQTDQPLLATYETGGTKKAVLFGENIWKWRSQNFKNTNSFEAFDEFIANLVQYLSANQQKERLNLSYEPFYHANEEVIVTAQYFDENYQFDARQQIIFSFWKKNGDKQSASFVLNDFNYEVNLGNLPAGEYEFSVAVQSKGVLKSGSFEILDFGVEQQFSSANKEKMEQLAALQEEKLFYISETESIIDRLLNDDRFVPVQKSNDSEIPMIDWYFLLFIIVLSLATEWFLRKYHGLI